MPIIKAAESKVVLRMDEYPQRFRARIAGRVTRITASAPGKNPRFEAEIIVERSKPLPPAKTHPLTGMPLAEMTEEDFDDSENVTAESEELPVSDLTVKTDPVPGFLLHKYSVRKEPEKNGPLYPEFPPVKAGGRVILIWHGQNAVPGILAGTYVRCSGMLSLRTQPATIFNPRYEIVPAHILESAASK